MLIIEAAIAVFEPTRGCDEPLFPSNPYCFSPPDAKKRRSCERRKKHGGDEGARTLDPHVANVVLSQLSYIPINRQDGIFLPSVALVKHKTKRKYKMADD